MFNLKQLTFLILFGLVLTLIGLTAAFFFGNKYWYSFFTIGGTLFLASINYRVGNKSILLAWEKNKQRFFYIYILYFLSGAFIEIVGKQILHLWQNPLTLVEQIVHVFLIAYPFAFFLLYESYILIKSYLRHHVLAIVLTTLVNAFLHEVPNTFAWPWTYNIPYIKWQVMGINIVVVIGWFILMAVPLIAHKVIKPTQNNPHLKK